MIWEGWRALTAAESIGIFLTLGLMATGRRSVRGIDYTLRMVALMVVFGIFTYASYAALHRHLPPQDYNPLLAAALALFWTTLLTPWRWDLRRRLRATTPRASR